MQNFLRRETKAYRCIINNRMLKRVGLSGVGCIAMPSVPSKETVANFCIIATILLLCATGGWPGCILTGVQVQDLDRIMSWLRGILKADREIT